MRIQETPRITQLQKKQPPPVQPESGWGLSGLEVYVGSVGLLMGAIPVVGAGSNALAGLLSNHQPEGLSALGALANMAGSAALLANYPVLGCIGLAASAGTCAYLYLPPR